MPRLEWTPNARRSLKQIAKYIARQDRRPSVADKLVDEIDAKCRQYSLSPGMGSFDNALPVGFRFFTHKRYVIVFEPLESGIRVHLVVDSARDWPRLVT